VATAFLDPGDAVLMVRGTYGTISFVATRAGASVHTVEYANGMAPLGRLGELAASLKPRLLYLVNPDNPAGCLYPSEALRELLRSTGRDTLVVLDEAYCDFAPEPQLLPLAERLGDSLLRLRTFSKIYALAGVKIGYAIGREDLIARLELVGMRYGVSRFAQCAAEVCLSDERLRAEMLEAHAVARRALVAALDELRVPVRVCATNFVLVDMLTEPRLHAALAHLAGYGVLTRAVAGGGHESLMRVSIAPEREMNRFVEAMAAFVLGERDGRSFDAAAPARRPAAPGPRLEAGER
jgi:histidinol-phosphate aminotransferase